MPLYEYKCHSCDQTIEVIQKFSDEPLKIHEGCGGELEKLISRSAFQLKGSGWYATDYAKRNGGPSKSEDSKKSEGKSDSKSESGSSESKTGESKSSEGNKPTESKASEAKPAPAASSSDTKS